jgi:hypothetical protein
MIVVLLEDAFQRTVSVIGHWRPGLRLCASNSEFVALYSMKSPLKNILFQCLTALIMDITIFCWTRGSVVVKALCYKPEGRGFETR